jgi:ribose transport system substrate-binding protein
VTLWLAILAVVLAGCGGGAPEEEGAAPAGGNQASGDGQAASEGGSATGGAGTEAASAGGGGGEAAEVLAQASAPQDEWAGPTQAPAPLPDATVGIIPCGLAIEGCAREARGAEEAAREIGWEPVVIDGQANPQAIQQGMETLINSGADAIILASVNAQDVGDQIRRAADQGIDVIATFASDPTEAGGIGEVGIDDFQAGRALAAYASQDPGGVVIFTQNESPAVAERADGFKAGLEEFAGDTEIVAEQSVPNSQLGAPQEQIMAGILQRNPAPSIRWVYAGFDFMLTPLVNEISRQGRTEIEGMSFDGNLENLQFIREGRVQSAVIGYPLEWAGWAAIDQLNRSLQDQPLVDQGIAFRLLTEDNLPPEGQPYTGDLDFRAEYRSLWGL